MNFEKQALQHYVFQMGCCLGWK